MYNGDSIWPYIHQKRKAAEAERENERLKEIVKKMLENKPLTDADKQFLKAIGL